MITQYSIIAEDYFVITIHDITNVESKHSQAVKTLAWDNQGTYDRPHHSECKHWFNDIC
jgi:hypothetical protein